ncbi:cryptochrome/photolyase family protein [Thaumasiovibrio subtropicus]|uniref:cryptochrome/photolyase family protein n=1 Tax=Thaumasiovibrio subtropicus TaxID=1891207 RepID=UPI000B351D10|nr:cryptochrome/photolyase family protein [Thaumasiovibrio subtropicus]
MRRTLRLILGDQLNANHSWFKALSPDVFYLIAELKQETDYVPHHLQKVCAFFASMSNFAAGLKQAGHQVIHLTLDDTRDYPDLEAVIIATMQSHGCECLAYQRPDEYRLLQQLREMPVEKYEVDTEHFLLPFEEIDQQFKADKPQMMAHFYRRMRKRFQLLLDENAQPLGGKWSFDTENRNKLSNKAIQEMVAPLMFETEVSAIRERINRHGVKTIGRLDGPLLWPTSRQSALALLDYFCTHCLPWFGRYQDAMTAHSPYRWSLYHSRLSFALNTKMLHPLQVINAAINAYSAEPEVISLAQVEGFVRQILGWREFVRGIYWVNMPEYQNKNALQAANKLPAYFWTGDTQMHCLSQAIQQSLDYAYAHHIQRLMVTGNFALLAGISPDEVDAWYLGIYIDAIEWVEMPNTRGMALFADGGLLASKPYAASGNYINKMSDYCKTCQYDVKKRHGEGACPMNSLYWRFMQTHRERFERNPRTAMIYRTWDRTSPEDQDAILSSAAYTMNHLETL